MSGTDIAYDTTRSYPAQRGYTRPPLPPKSTPFRVHLVPEMQLLLFFSAVLGTEVWYQGANPCSGLPLSAEAQGTSNQVPAAICLRARYATRLAMGLRA
eukprot:3028405-Rhodomonas_salina.1